MRPLLGRDLELALLRNLHARAALVWIRGDPGSGRTAVLDALVPPEALRVCAAGCRSPADLLRAVGGAAGVVPAGDERAVLDALRARTPRLLAVDEVEPGAVPLLQALVDGCPGLHVVATCGLEGPEPGVELGPLAPSVLEALFPGCDAGAARGNPLLAELGVELGLPVAELAARLATLRLPALAAGLPGRPGPGLPRVLFRPHPTRAWLRAGVQALAARTGPGEALSALSAFSAHLPLAEGVHLDAPVVPEDILALRELSALAPRAAGIRCGAAASRLLVAAGQVDEARKLLAGLSPTSGTERALLSWADGAALLASGDQDAACARWRAAAEDLRQAGERVLRARLLRRSADHLAARGAATEAAGFYRLARAAYRATHQGLGVFATLRGTADLAVSTGELMAAETLHDEASLVLAGEGTAPPIERATLVLGQATLLAERGELARAERLVEGLETRTESSPLFAANLARRRADFAFTRGDHARAAALAAEAALTYATLGEVVARAACLGLQGSAALALGDQDLARTTWHQALQLQLGAQDLPGLRRTLARLQLLDELHEDAAGARQRAEQQAALAVLLGREAEGTGEPGGSLGEAP